MTAALGGLMIVHALGLVGLIFAALPYLPVPKAVGWLTAGVLFTAATYNSYLGFFVLEYGELDEELAVVMLSLMSGRTLFTYSLLAYVLWWLHGPRKGRRGCRRIRENIENGGEHDGE